MYYYRGHRRCTGAVLLPVESRPMTARSKGVQAALGPLRRLQQPQPHSAAGYEPERVITEVISFDRTESCGVDKADWRPARRRPYASASSPSLAAALSIFGMQVRAGGMSVARNTISEDLVAVRHRKKGRPPDHRKKIVFNIQDNLRSLDATEHSPLVQGHWGLALSCQTISARGTGPEFPRPEVVGHWQ
ncbi:hypothetical protein H4582DRAFT_2059296 [Lactarius indigo]|nr:hypothetical protein H4582DRAFT_2059296 [Lactarius indigo]